MEHVISRITEVGAHFDVNPDGALELAKMVPRRYFTYFDQFDPRTFSFLKSIPFSEAFSFIKGLSLCEVVRSSHYGGSVSLINPAFRVVMERPIEEWVEVAIWVIKHN